MQSYSLRIENGRRAVEITQGHGNLQKREIVLLPAEAGNLIADLSGPTRLVEPDGPEMSGRGYISPPIW